MGVYRVPQVFHDRLDEEFKGKIRIRWSDEQEEWHVEQKVRSGLAGSPLTSRDDYNRNYWRDDVIRSKDDYMWVMSVKQGTTFACPTCASKLIAPTRSQEMISCGYCKQKGYEHHVLAGHWPLDETLIDHLKKLEWQLDHPEQHAGASLTAQNAALKKIQERRVLDPTMAAWEDRYNKIVGIPSVGYTGKVFTG